MRRVKRVLAYARVSGHEQGMHGTSLAGQRDEIVRYCRGAELPTPKFFVEIESAGAEKLERRAILRQLLSEVREGDLVVVSKQDRWSRDVLFYLQSVRDLTARGAHFFSIAERFDPETPEGRFAATVMAAVAEQERERIRVRTVGRRKALRDEGRYVEGLPPVGYRRGEKNILQIVPEDAAVVLEVYRRCIAGESVSIICEHLRDAYPDRHGWDKKTINIMLRSRVYLGEVKLTDGTWKAAHEPIVTRSQHEFVARALDSRRLGGRRPESASRTSSWLLRGLATCAKCGSIMSAAYSPRDLYYYACRNRMYRHTCPSGYVRVEPTDRAVAAMSLDRLRELRAELAGGPSVAQPAAKDFAASMERLARKRERLIDMAADGTIGSADLRKRLSGLEGQLAALEVEQADAARQAEAARPEVRRDMLATVGVLEKRWRAAPPEVQREILKHLASTVRLEAGMDPDPVWRDVSELRAEV